jgi:hypothetical protein
VDLTLLSVDEKLLFSLWMRRIPLFENPPFAHHVAAVVSACLPE